MARKPLFEHLVIGCRRRWGEGVAERLELVPGRVEIVAAERDMLDTLAIIGAQIFLDLALVGRAIFAERDANLAVGRPEDGRGGKESVSTCRSQWSPYHYNKIY